MGGRMARSGLSQREELFIDEYMKDMNGQQAAIRAGYAKSGASVQASKLLGKAKVAEALAKKMHERSIRTQVTQDRVLEEYAKIAFFDPRRMYREDGSPIPVHELPPEVAAAISSIEIDDIWEGSGEDRRYVGTTNKIKMASKVAALDSCARHLGMFNDKLQIDVNTGLAEKLARARKLKRGDK